MVTDGLDFPTRTIRTKWDGKLSSRWPTRKISMCNASGEVYYGDSSLSIPFMWESQPGTPKVRFHETPLPPLTPPPSYLSNLSKKPMNRHSKTSFFHSILHKLTPKKTCSSATFASSSSSPWSSSNSTTSSPFGPLSGELRVLSPRSYFDSGRYEEDRHESPVSPLCFGITRSGRGGSRSRSVKVLQYA